MDDTLDNRVARLEFRVDAQDSEMATMKKMQETFGQSLKAIETTLVQIKWALYGAGMVFVTNYMGLKEVLTKLFLH